MVVCVERVGRGLGHCLDSKANRKGITKADTGNLKPDSPCPQLRGPGMLPSLGSRGPGWPWRNPGPCPAPSSHFARVPLTQPECWEDPSGFMPTAGETRQIHNLLGV